MKNQEDGLIPGERKIVQLNSHLIEGKKSNTILLVVLCDDGTIWHKYCDPDVSEVIWERSDNFTGKVLTPLQVYNKSTR